jgi:hypothetical protein
MVVMTAANFAMTPSTKSQMAHAQPAWHDATAVKEITPAQLHCSIAQKVVKHT